MTYLLSAGTAGGVSGRLAALQQILPVSGVYPAVPVDAPASKDFAAPLRFPAHIEYRVCFPPAAIRGE